MLEFLTSADGVIALEIGGKLTQAELDEIVRRLETSLDARDKTHLFIHVHGFSGFDLSALPTYLPRAGAMLRKLGRFGRIAVVSDQPWVRAWTRIESALLPGISYEVFTPDQRDQALAWVDGRRAWPHEPALKVIETDNPDVLGFELDGKIRADEVRAIATIFQEAFERDHPVRLLGRVKRLDVPELSAFCNSDYVRMKLAALHRVERYALVGGPAWLAAWIGMLDPLVRAEVRHFEPEDESVAWSWLGARPLAERSVA